MTSPKVEPVTVWTMTQYLNAKDELHKCHTFVVTKQDYEAALQAAREECARLNDLVARCRPALRIIADCLNYSADEAEKCKERDKQDGKHAKDARIVWYIQTVGRRFVSGTDA